MLSPTGNRLSPANWSYIRRPGHITYDPIWVDAVSAHVHFPARPTDRPSELSQIAAAAVVCGRNTYPPTSHSARRKRWVSIFIKSGFARWRRVETGGNEYYKANFLSGHSECLGLTPFFCSLPGSLLRGHWNLRTCTRTLKKEQKEPAVPIARSHAPGRTDEGRRNGIADIVASSSSCSALISVL